MAETKMDKQIDEMFQVGAHYGYSKSRRHPSTKDYIYGAKNKTEIIDLEKTIDLLERAKAYVRGLALEGKVLLFVGTKPEAKNWIVDNASKIGMPYVSERWIGGMITNFSEAKKRVARLTGILDKKEKGELDVYTKRERMLLDEEAAKLQKNFGGVVNMQKLPDVLFVVDPKKEKTAIREAVKKDIPIIALASSDCDISNIDYPIVANDAVSKSVEYFVSEIAGAFKETKKSIPEESKSTESEKNE